MLVHRAGWGTGWRNIILILVRTWRESAQLWRARALAALLLVTEKRSRDGVLENELFSLAVFEDHRVVIVGMDLASDPRSVYEYTVTCLRPAARR
jgi:hypothetical protein